MAEQELDRNEAATPYKLEKAKERGQVPKSADVASLAILATVSLACAAWLGTAAVRLAHVAADVLHGVGSELGTVDQTARVLERVLVAGMELLAPLLLAIVCAAVVSGIAQFGVVFSVDPVKPDFQRINPAQGFRRIVSLRSLYEGAKGVLKLGLLGGVLFLALREFAAELLSAGQMGTSGYPRLLAHLLGSLMVKLLLALVLLAVIDWVVTRRQFARQMRMSKREVKEEYKQREGDPRIRSRIRELRAKWLKRSQGLREVPNADVLITNPTRVAVAVRYEHGVSPAPLVVAKGAGALAARMRDLAFTHQVPIVQNRTLARALYREADEGTYVPERWYPHIAKILLWLQASRGRRPFATGATR